MEQFMVLEIYGAQVHVGFWRGRSNVPYVCIVKIYFVSLKQLNT